MNLIKSPLRYPGGKGRGASQILRVIPKHVDLCAPFLGGGSVEIACAQRGQRVFGYDFLQPLVDFWQCALQNPQKLALLSSAHHPLPTGGLKNHKEACFAAQTQMERAVSFWVLNRCSFCGAGLSGGGSTGNTRFTQASIAALGRFKVEGMSVQQACFRDSIPIHASEFLYLDPPYATNWENLYGVNGNSHRNFDHPFLARLLAKRDGWVLSYNDCEVVRDLYEGHPIVKVNWAYGMGKKRKCNELLVLSQDLAHVKKYFPVQLALPV